MKLCEIPEKLYKASVFLLFTGSLFVLSFFSLISTAYITNDAQEKTYFVKDNGWILLLLLALLILLGCFLCSREKTKAFLLRLETDEALYRRLRKLLLLSLFGLSAFWVLATQYNAGADQFSVQQSVYTLHAGNYYQFDPETGGYISRYPNQQGLLLLSWLLSVLFGNYNYVVFQLLCAACIPVIYGELAEFTLRLGMKKRVSLAVMAAGFLFFPLMMYCSFIYGTVPGLACALAALRRELDFLKKPGARAAFLSAALMVLACMCKSNYLIFLIGAVLFGLVRSLSAKRMILAVLPLMMLGLYYAEGQAADILLQKVTGYPVTAGTSPWSFVAMGLQRGSKRAPGWYNSYNYSSYGQADYDTEKQAEAARKNLAESLTFFRENKKEALIFFSQKTASQWNNPNFQSFWIVQVRSSDVSKSGWLYAFTSSAGCHRATAFLNVLHFLILAGALLFTVFYGKTEKKGEALLLPMIFVGGFLFHLFWEAKAQYTLPYFVLLLPLAAAGYNSLLEELLKAGTGGGRLCGTPGSRKHCLRTGLLFLLLTGLLLSLYGKDKAGYLRSDDAAYREFLEKTDSTPVLEGSFRIRSADGRSLCLSERGELLLAVGDGTVFHITEYQGTYWISTAAERLYLKTADSGVPGQKIAELSPSTMANNEKWQIAKGNGGYTILCDSRKNALSWASDSPVPYVTALEEKNVFQIWTAEKVG